MSSVIALPAMIVLAIIFCLPILVGVYVYRDAVRRNMSAGLWALAAALVPAFIGLIVYLLVRSEYAPDVRHRLRRILRFAPSAARSCAPAARTVKPRWSQTGRSAPDVPRSSPPTKAMCCPPSGPAAAWTGRCW